MLMKHHIATPKSSTPLCPHSELEQQKLEDSVLLESSQEISDHIEESQSRTLFVGDLHRDTVHEDILNLFSSCGEVREVRLKHAKVTKHPLGYGFVDMENHESAALCIERLNGVSLKGKQISVRWASRNKKLFITNIGRSVHINDILSLCEAYGSVCPERSSLNKADSGNIYAVVEFDRREAAETARLALNGSVLHLNGEETTVFANWEQSLSYRTNQSPESHPSPFPYYSVHISFRATATHIRVSEKMIYQAYKNFGSMTTVTIKNVFLDQNSRTQSGFGFIHFETIEGARAAVNFGSCLHFGGVNYNAEFSKHLMKRGERKTPSYQPAPPPHPIAGPGPGTQSISWMTPPQSPRINAPQFPGNYTPQFPGHYTPQFSGHYTPYPSYTCYPQPGAFSASYQLPYSTLPWQDSYSGADPSGGYPDSYGSYY